MPKKLIKNSIAYTVIGFLPLSFSLIFTPIYLNYLDEEQYGLLNLFMVFSGILAQLLSFGIGNLFMFKYWDVYKDASKLKELISSTLGSILFLQLILIPILLLLGPYLLNLFVENEEFSYAPFYVCTIAFSAFMVFYEIFIALFRNEADLKSFSILSISALVLMTVGSVVGVIIIDLKAEGAIYGRLFGYGSIISIFLFLIIRKYGLRFKLNALKTSLLLGAPIFVNSIVGAVGYGFDKLMVERYINLKSLGVYAFAVVIVSTLEILFNALNNALGPTIFKHINEAKGEISLKANALIHSMILILLLAISLVCLILHPVLDLLIPENFHWAAKFVPVLGAAIIWRIFTTTESMVIYKQKKTNYLLFNQISFLISLFIFGYFLHAQLGLVGIAIAVLIARVIEYFLMRQINKRIEKVNFQLSNFRLASVIFGIVGIACSLLYQQLNTLLLFSFPLICTLFLSFTVLHKDLVSLIEIVKNPRSILN